MVFKYEDLKVGDSNFFEKTVSEADILLFSAVSGDQNPMHCNDKFASQSKFGKRIAHGALTNALISTALTKTFPTSIYISQHTEFMAPVYIGDTIRATVTCLEKLEKGRVRMKTECFNQDEVLVVTGEAVVRCAREIPPELL